MHGLLGPRRGRRLGNRIRSRANNIRQEVFDVVVSCRNDLFLNKSVTCEWQKVFDTYKVFGVNFVGFGRVEVCPDVFYK